VADVRAFLTPHGVEVLELPDDAGTAVLAAQALNTSVDTIVKSLLFFADEAPILVLAPGDLQVSTTRLAGRVQAERVRLARPKEVLQVTGYAVGGVPPVAHAHTVPIVIDRHLLAHPVIFAAAGDRQAVFPVEPQKLVELTGATPVDIAE
jgi:Cys-tRNA(Pro) deacylase